MNGRIKRFLISITTGYLAITINIAYTMASIPLALHYLGKEEFGLWALSQQIAGYILLLDLGLSNAISRFFSNWKDNVDCPEYKELFGTSFVVFIAQGILIALMGIAFSLIAPWLFHIPESLSRIFQKVLILITSLSGFSVACRGISGPIWAFQRLDVANASMAFNLISSFGILWLGFHWGWGIYSLALAIVPAAIITPVAMYFFCRHSGYYPKSGILGRPNRELFWKLFHFGKDTMLISLGQQMVNASQLMIVSRFIGLEMAATFAVGTKIFALGQQFVGKVLESAAPGLTEIYVRGDRELFRRRYWKIIDISMALATIGAAGLILGNQSLISIWTDGLIHWPMQCDVLLGFLLVATTLSRCFTGLFGMIGNMRPIRFIYLMEGLIFLTTAYFAATRYGLIGVVAASLVAHIIVTLSWSIGVQGEFLLKMPDMIRILLPGPMICLAITLVKAYINIYNINFLHQVGLEALLFLATCLAVCGYCFRMRLFRLS
jgi:O-antigen/teichoic acid export membrane protein